MGSEGENIDNRIMSKLMRRCGSFSDDASAGDRDSADDGKCRNNTEYRREKCALCTGAG